MENVGVNDSFFGFFFQISMLVQLSCCRLCHGQTTRASDSNQGRKTGPIPRREFKKPWLSLRVRLYARSAFKIVLYIGIPVAILGYKRHYMIEKARERGEDYPATNFEWMKQWYQGTLREDLKPHPEKNAPNKYFLMNPLEMLREADKEVRNFVVTLFSDRDGDSASDNDRDE